MFLFFYDINILFNILLLLYYYGRGHWQILYPDVCRHFFHSTLFPPVGVLSHSTFCPIQRFFHSTLFPFGVSYYSTFCLIRRFFRSTFCPIRRFFHSTFCPIGVLSFDVLSFDVCTFGLCSFDIFLVNRPEACTWRCQTFVSTPVSIYTTQVGTFF